MTLTSKTKTRPAETSTAPPLVWRAGLVLSVLTVGLGGGLAPWVYREAVALQLTAPGLAEYVKFLAENRLGLLTVQRLYFLLPLAVAVLSLPLLTANKTLALPPAVRWFLRLSVIPLALNLLSPVWAPGVLLNSEFRLQTLVALLGIGLAVIAPVFKVVALKWLLPAVTLSHVLAIGLAVNHFNQLTPAIEATYASPIGLGWGGWLTIAGGLGLVVCSAWWWSVGREG